MLTLFPYLKPDTCTKWYPLVRICPEELGPLPYPTPPSLKAGLLSRAGAETPLNFREKFRVFSRTILEIFSGVDTRTAVLVSTAEVWISAPDTQTPIFLVFWVSTADFGFSAGTRKFSDFFPEVPVAKIRVSAPDPYKNPTVIVAKKSLWFCVFLPCFSVICKDFWQVFSSSPNSESHIRSKIACQ